MVVDQLLQTDRVVLASRPPFCLGGAIVTPALLQIEAASERIALEPRVTQVLVVLAESLGRVVSRAELVERCWDGRIVGENALQRVISRIRHLADTLGGFEVETITRVGYRLRLLPEADTADAPAPVVGRPELAPPVLTPPVLTPPALAPPASAAPAQPGRRGLLLGAMALVGAGSLGAWRVIGADNPDVDTAKALVKRGRDLLGTGLQEQNGQAIAYLRQATRLDPGAADAWGALALAYQDKLDGEDGAPQQALAEWTRSASQRALALAPENLDAQVALATIPSNFGNWAANERVLRALLATHGSQAVIESALGWLLCDTGRWREALGCFRRALAFEPFHPLNQLILAWGLWGSGNLDEADRLLAKGLELWPQHRLLWHTRFDFLATTGRPGQAIAILDDARARPVVGPDADPPPYPILRRFAVAVDSGTAPDAAGAAAEIVAARQAIGTIPAVTYLATLGQVDRAFALLEGFYFGGDGRPPPGRLSRRKTSMLFSAKGAPLRRDARWQALVDRVGLQRYWQETGTGPDRNLRG